MRSRRVLVVDRTATLLLGLVLLAGGALAIWWWSGTSWLVDPVDTAPVSSVTQAGWWPAAAAAVGLLLALLGLRWLLAHLRRATVSSLRLDGSGRGGRLEVDTAPVVGAAADAYAETIGVRSTSGRILRDRGQLVVRLSATIDRDADLAVLAERADRVAADMAQAMQRPDLRFSVELKVVGQAASMLSR